MATQKTVKLSDYYMRKEGTNGSEATQSAKGLMSSTDKTKLDGIATNANNYVHPSTLGVTKNQSLYYIAIDANGHITQTTQIPIDLYSNGSDAYIYDSIHGDNLLNTDWDMVYELFGYDITQLLEDNSSGKNLSTNDYTTAEKNKLANLQISDISGLSNALSTALSYYVITQATAELIVGRNNDIEELNDQNFDTAMQYFISGGQYQALTPMLTQENKIILLPDKATPTFFYEYMYINNRFELLGTNKDIDLSPYLLEEDFDTSIALKADKTNGATQITDNRAYSAISTSSGATQSAINYAINNKINDLSTNKLNEADLVDKLNDIILDLIELGE